MTTDTMKVRRLTTADLLRMREDGQPIVMLTAYDVHSARLADEAGVDMLLVGDSAAMVMLGHASTVTATMDVMVELTAAVVRGSRRAFVVADMPFMSYQPSDELAIANAGRFMAQSGADAVKLEGGGLMADRVRAITASGISVIGHLGLTPQTATALGGYRAQARTSAQAVALVKDAILLQQAGACCLVLEAVPPQVADLVTERITIPTIGIGAGAGTSGQVLVWHDLLGITPEPLPRFVRRFADVSTVIRSAIGAYADDVRSRAFPAAEHTYGMPEAESDRLREQAAPNAPRLLHG